MYRCSIIAMVLAAVSLQQEYIECAEHKGCGQQLCGDFIIEYPFGIGPHCSLDNDYFAVSCDNSSLNSKPVRPILTKFNLELIDVWSELRGNSVPLNAYGVITVKMPIAKVCIAKHSAPHNQIQWSSLNLSGSPFQFDPRRNVLVSVGCPQNMSLYDEQGRKIGGCSSTCNPSGEVTQGCNGYYCCQSDLWRAVSEYTVRVSGSNESTASESSSCTTAFLVSRSFLQANNPNLSSAAMVDHSLVPVVLTFDSSHQRKGSVQSVIYAVFLELILPVLGTLLLCCCCFWSCWLWKTKERRKEVKLRAKYFKGRLEERSNDKEVVEKTKLFTFDELNRATNNFNEDCVLGQGGQGTVYKGVLTNGQVIAVKRSKAFDEKQWKQFINEVILLSQVSHINVVKLLGCCLETKVPLLVYEFIPNGTLLQHIHNSTDEFLLTWETRLRIASETANAIAYLHSSSSTPIYHRDVKSTNILLDDKYQAKVADFGISRAVHIDQTHFTTCVQGTFGYLDPEYFESSQFSEKSDVYSFGVVLVELLTGQEPIRASVLDEERSLVEYFISAMDRLCLDAILDPIVVQGNAKDTIMSVAILARQCLQVRGLERPTMKEVSNELHALVKKTSMHVVLDQQVSIEIEVVHQSNIETYSTLTSPAMYGIINFDGIQSEEQPLFITT